jgi:UDPglucose--hexose-1-phosphate uridylyltransferase
VLWEREADGEAPWHTRVVPNKYPALTTARDRFDQTCGLYRSRASYGVQEVIVDTPYHYQGLAHMPVAQVEAVLHTYLVRYRSVRAEKDNLYPFVFRNHGARAGASLPHPHSQLIATAISPPRIEREEAAARERFDETGRCPYCEMIDVELDSEARLVWANEDIVVFVPYAARVPYEMWILPRDHEPEFGRLTAAVRSSLATALHEAVSRLYVCLDDPDYNFFVRTALEHESKAPHLHWSLRIQPRTTVEAGFELSTGVQVNPSIPERDAAVLRGAT